ncbi:peptide ABC transporter permease [Bacillus manliponensis]|uniref:Peptide ABC transporter permease n=1 Tax=Bacillus manliponensis TaxID=574376 RepID=A0A073JRD7_9BACI|nr:peptide ABC transporter permease [Bacillus manliponensis]KEK17649.1 peptide ABC transporter permease [Bacillus manliponensis]
MHSRRYLYFFVPIFIMLCASFLLPYVQEERERVLYTYDEEGKVDEAAPFSFSRTYWFGTDREGGDLFYKVIDGAKYTILISFFVACMRVIIAVCFSFFIKKRKSIFESLRFFPQTLFCLLFLSPFIIYEVRTKPIVSNVEVLCIQLIVFVVIAVPGLTRFFQTEVEQLWRKEYVQSAFVLGGSKWHVFRTHIIKGVWPKMMFQIGEQMVQVLLLMLHLALFKIFLGGTKIVSGQVHDQYNVYSPYVTDWANLISYYYIELMIEPRIVMVPVLFYMILLFCMTKAVEGYKKEDCN